MKLLSLLAFWCSAAAVGLGAATESSEVAAVKRADQARTAAMMAGDALALGEVFSETLVFAHSDGRVESKADYVKALLAGDTAYANVRITEVQTVQPSSEVVVLVGRQDMRKRVGADWSTITLRFLSVWHHERGSWRMVAWQSARPAGNSIPPATKK